MNLFTEINWHNVRQSGFLDDDHIRKHSFTFRILSDEFKLSKDLKKTQETRTSRSPGGDNESSGDESEDKRPDVDDLDGGGNSCWKDLAEIDNHEGESGRRPRRYIAGLVGGLPFPKHSSLTKEEQAMYLQLHSKFLNRTLMVASNISAEQQKIFATYIELNKRVMTERAEFLAFLKDYWRIQSIKFMRLPTEVERYISESWKHRIDTRLSPYMRYYVKSNLMPLVYQGEKNHIQLIAGDLILQLGTSALMVHPKFKQRIQINQDALTVSKRYPPDCTKNDVDTSNTIHKVPVSRDVNARQLALAYEADIVISSSGLKALTADRSTAWDVPVVVDRFEPVSASDRSRKIVFVDRPLPCRAMSVADRSRRFHKLGVKTLWRHPRNKNSYRFTPVQEEEGSEDGRRGSKRRKVDTPENQQGSKGEDATETATDVGSSGSPKARTTFLEPSPYTNVNYRLWTMGKEKERKEELPRHMMKQSTGSADRELRILVRNKLDGFVMPDQRNKNVRVPMSVLPKLEYQSEFGAEKMTRSELTNEWLTLKFRPGSTLTRARVNAETSEVLLAETLTLEQVTREGNRSYGANFVPDVTSTLYTVLSGLVGLAPGQYLLSHSSTTQAFALLQKGQTDFGSVDLETVFSKVDAGAEPPCLEDPPWVEVDTNFTMPYHAVFNRVPGTFNPLYTIKPPPATSTPTASKVAPGKKKKKSKREKSKKTKTAAKAVDLDCPW